MGAIFVEQGRFPTIKIFGANKRSPWDYLSGKRDVEAIVDVALNEAEAKVRAALSDGSGSGTYK